MKMLGLGLGMALGLARNIGVWWRDDIEERVSTLIKEKKKNYIPGVPSVLPSSLCNLDVVI